MSSPRAALGMDYLPGLYSRIFADSGVVIETGKRYGPEPRQLLDVYRPAADAGTGPLAVFIYGGGWTSGERATYGFVGTGLASRGITTVIPDYRLFPEVTFPRFIEDAARAYSWTSATLAGGAGGRRPIFLIGHSAGGYIAALLAYDGRYLAGAGAGAHPPAGLVGLAGPYAFDLSTFEPTAAIFAGADPRDVPTTNFVRPGAPRSLLMHGLSDDTVKIENGRVLAKLLTDVGTPVRKIEPPGIGHAGLVLAISRPFRWRAPVLPEIATFVHAAG